MSDDILQIAVLQGDPTSHKLWTSWILCKPIKIKGRTVQSLSFQAFIFDHHSPSSAGLIEEKWEVSDIKESSP